ncbi:thioredoxin family protein [Paenibacillus roseipurpureus]|uniref:Thioredoxin family protein n=1 Tax=Paenibacillus roseopurpureus TaxID=2918901 RepID=A0AA96LKC8_9BACL|nr:thioredoxin family protein [Paenibacillus sp. MBLB1832]WNR42702.1 thioredoxin family protein [Paenibacillus sp. MBLB1832]
MSAFHCKHCGKAIFRKESIIEEVNLWDLTEYQAHCYAITEAIELESFRRYDASLHEGWYCCRFIMMRMIVDKFGTGDKLLVYADSVVEVKDGEPVPKQQGPSHQIKLGKIDFDQVVHHPEAANLQDKLLVVKLGAIWCPPCRLMDRVIDSLKRKKRFA